MYRTATRKGCIHADAATRGRVPLQAMEPGEERRTRCNNGASSTSQGTTEASLSIASATARWGITR